jgi:sugar phosphate isomerase/epimerase
MAWKIGCNSDGFMGADTGTEKPFIHMLRTLAEMGYDSIEPQVMTGWASSILYEYDPTLSLESDPIEIRNIVKDFGLEIVCVSAHANLMDLGEAGAGYLKKAIPWAKLVGARIVNTSEGPRPEYLTEEEGFQAMKLNLKSILRMAENFDIKITIEPHNIYTVQTETMLRILELVESDHFGVNFDTGNVTLFGTDAVEMLEAVKDKVMHMHLKDLDKETYEKNKGKTGIPFGTVLGEGIVPIKECIDLLKKAGFDGELSVECGLPGLKKSIDYVRSIV